MDWENIPGSWPKHFNEAIRIMNWHFLPSLKFSPKELLLGLVVNTTPTNVDLSILPVMEQDVATQTAYVAQQQLDGYAEAVAHAVKRKSWFDRRVLAHKTGEVIFSTGQLVQVYRSDLDETFKTEGKLLPKWSPPYRILSRMLNLYTLETLKGMAIKGHFSTRCLRGFTPREGTELARAQNEVEEACCKKEEEREKEELTKIEEERRLHRVEEDRQREEERRRNGDEQQEAGTAIEEGGMDVDDEEAEEDKEGGDEEEQMGEMEEDHGDD